MRRISRKMFNDCIGNADAIKAVAMLIFVKEQKPASVIADFSYYKLAKITNLHHATCKRLCGILRNMDLVEFVGREQKNLLFKKVRAPKSNIRIDNIDHSSVKSIETGLRAMLLVEIQNQKNFIKQRVIRANNPKGKCSSEEYKAFKRARKFCTKRGIEKFEENGISYKTLGRRMNVGSHKVSEVIKYAERNKMIVKTRHREVYALTNNNARNVVLFSGKNNLFPSKDNNIVYSCSANTYSIHPSMVAYVG